LKDYRMPASVIAALYRNVLVNIEPASIQNEPKKEESDPGQKEILIIVNERKDDYMFKILHACRIEDSKIARVVLGGDETSNYKDLMKRYACRIMILFGVPPVKIQLPVDFPAFQLQPFNGVTYLWGPSLGELEPDKTAREKLWQSMKRLFNI
jgi:hypothetical protein